MKEGILTVLKAEGFIEDFRVAEEGTGKVIFIYLKYGEDGEQFINNIKRASNSSVAYIVTPRTCAGFPVLDGMGIAVVSTSKGIMSDRECVKQNLGGEVLCSIR